MGRLPPGPWFLPGVPAEVSGVKRDFTCTFTRHFQPMLVALRSQSRLRLEERTRMLSGPSADLSSARTVAPILFVSWFEPGDHRRLDTVPADGDGVPGDSCRCLRRTTRGVATGGFSPPSGEVWAAEARVRVSTVKCINWRLAAAIGTAGRSGRSRHPVCVPVGRADLGKRLASCGSACAARAFGG
jgi:hypothetical protein